MRTSNVKTGDPDARDAHQPAAPAHDRRHDGAQAWAATQKSYIRAVKILSAFLGRSPATATAENLRRFQVHQSEAGTQPSAMNNTVTGCASDRPEMGRHLTLVRQARKLPNVLNEEEVVRLLEHASGLKYRAALGVAYGAGLRVSEVAANSSAWRSRAGRGCSSPA